MYLYLNINYKGDRQFNFRGRVVFPLYAVLSQKTVFTVAADSLNDIILIFLFNLGIFSNNE